MALYLSRIRLNTQRRNTQIAMTSPAKFHGAVEECFGSKGDRKLWRLDTLSGEYYMLILSPQKPDLSKLREQFGYPDSTDEIKCYDEFLNSIENDSVWHFRLVANPTHSIKGSEQARGKVVAHVSEKYQMEWLYKKAQKNGFTILTEGSCVAGSGWKLFRKNNSGKMVRLKEAVFQGILMVDNVELFRKALVDGIGRGKAYGMGLLTIVKVREAADGNECRDKES